MTLHNGLLFISGSAFEETSIEDIVIPNTVYNIGKNAFCNSSLKTITIPVSVQCIGRNNMDWYYDLNNATIRCYPNSFAHYEAMNANAKYVLLDAVPSTSVKINNPTIYLFNGESRKILYSITQSNITDAVLWASSSTDTVTVNPLGEITGKSTGTATIIATTTSGKRATVNVVVSNKPTDVYFAK